MSDPRIRNINFDITSMTSFMKEYSDHLSDAIKGVDPALLSRAADKINDTSMSGGKIFSIGNGGSAAISDHLCLIGARALIKMVSLLLPAS